MLIIILLVTLIHKKGSDAPFHDSAEGEGVGLATPVARWRRRRIPAHNFSAEPARFPRSGLWRKVRNPSIILLQL